MPVDEQGRTRPKHTVGEVLAMCRSTAFIAVLAICGSTHGSSPARADELIPETRRFKATPYLWAMSVDGNTTVKGQKSDVDMSFSDIVDKLNFGLFGALEAQKGRFGVFLNGMYAKLEADNDVGPLSIDANVDLGLVESGAFYRLGPWQPGADMTDAGPAIVADPFVGARYTYVDVDLDLGTPVAGNRNLEGDQSWVDPIVGLRTIVQFSPRWSLTALGDIGGFGVGSDLTWQAAGLVGYRFGLFGGDRNATLVAGYRALFQDYSDGNGQDRFEWDVVMQGPMLGLTIAF